MEEWRITVYTFISIENKFTGVMIMSDELRFRFKNLDTAWNAREEINKICSGLPASGGYASDTVTLDLNELSKNSSETARNVQTIIDRYGGESW